MTIKQRLGWFLPLLFELVERYEIKIWQSRIVHENIERRFWIQHHIIMIASAWALNTIRVICYLPSTWVKCLQEHFNNKLYYTKDTNNIIRTQHNSMSSGKPWPLILVHLLVISSLLLCLFTVIILLEQNLPQPIWLQKVTSYIYIHCF